MKSASPAIMRSIYRALSEEAEPARQNVDNIDGMAKRKQLTIKQFIFNAVVELSGSQCHIDIKRVQSCSECCPLLPSLLWLSLLKGSLCKTPPLWILTHPFMAELCSLVNPAFKRAETWRLSPLAASAPSWRPPKTPLCEVLKPSTEHLSSLI